jgi:hypothetical protein
VVVEGRHGQRWSSGRDNGRWSVNWWPSTTWTVPVGGCWCPFLVGLTIAGAFDRCSALHLLDSRQRGSMSLLRAHWGRGPPQPTLQRHPPVPLHAPSSNMLHVLEFCFFSLPLLQPSLFYCCHISLFVPCIHLHLLRAISVATSLDSFTLVAPWTEWGKRRQESRCTTAQPVTMAHGASAA